jgi:UDP-GlcNAc:undecaprenyl-phosphate GlcNAc-1-phosphate transferase
MGWGDFLAYVSRLVLLGLLIFPPIRGWFFMRGLSGLYLVSFTFLVAFVVVPLVQFIAIRYDVVDLPAARKVHKLPTPLLGGLAVYFAFALGLLYNFSFSSALKGVALGGTLILMVGVLDDIVNLRAALKLAGQLLGAVIAVSYGVTLNLVPDSFGWWSFPASPSSIS